MSPVAHKGAVLGSQKPLAALRTQSLAGNKTLNAQNRSGVGFHKCKIPKANHYRVLSDLAEEMRKGRRPLNFQLLVQFLARRR